ncbi:MAG: flippase-like domain-containing protein [Novosphingobium sp.]|nr:flippase-like domain-containing protein [Novosphingobium sp.]
MASDAVLPMTTRPETSIPARSKPVWSRTAAIVWSLVLFVLALACTVALGAWSGLTAGDALQTLVSAPLWLVAAITGLTVLQVAFSALKWQRVLAKTGGEQQGVPFSFYYGCTALAAFMSQFLTVYLASIIVRGWAVKRWHGLNASHGAGTSLFEQVFDVLVLVVMALPALIVWSLGGTLGQWAMVTVAALIAGAACLRFVGPAIGALAVLERFLPKMRKLVELFERSTSAGLLSQRFMFEIYALSVLRYFTLLVRAPLLIVAFGLPLAMSDIVPGFTIVQATQLAAITPGQLGIREWTWSGILALRGYDLQLAAHFAIDLRIIGMLAIALAALPVVALLRRRHRP